MSLYVVEFLSYIKVSHNGLWSTTVTEMDVYFIHFVAYVQNCRRAGDLQSGIPEVQAPDTSQNQRHTILPGSVG